MASDTLLDDYYRTREFSAQLDGRPLRVMTKPGFAGWDTVWPAAELLLDAVGAAQCERLALFGCGHGALAVALARRMPRARLALLDTSCVALAMAEQTLAANQVRSAGVAEGISLLPEGTGCYDGVVIDLPQGRALARRWLLEAHALLQPGARLWLAGPNELGIQSVADDVRALFGNLDLHGYRRKCRAVTAIRQEQSPPAPQWASLPGIAPGTWSRVPVVLAPGGPLVQLVSLAGVFSADELDPATALLLQHIPPLQGKQVADAGCGYGVLGIAAALHGAAGVAMVDANVLAVASARENATRLALDVTIEAGDGLAPLAARRFDVVLSNPPFHAGKRVSYNVADVFIHQSHALLRPNGKLAIVANRFIPYQRELGAVFGNCEVVAHTKSFHVLVATR